MKNLKGDILTVKEGYICHQVNIEGKMGAGLALQIKKKWPHVYYRYKSVCDSAKNRESILLSNSLLGKILVVPINDELDVINLFGQLLFTSERPTRYDAVVDAFETMMKSDVIGSSLYVPKNMGCALGGGDWDIYLPIILHYFPQVNIVDYELGKEVYDPDL